MDERRILDRYRLVDRLAAGGTAEVWRARDEQLDRDVAVKLLHPHLFADASSRARLAAEARAAARLSHPVIVDVYDVDAIGDAPALVMELVDGESLASRLARDGALPEREAASIAADLAEALFHAHQQGVIHRDIKPENVLLAAGGRTRLVDFGIAHSLADAAERLTLTGTVIGTLRAMAPEQLADGTITPRTDLYGLGVVLHEALTGQPPYPSASPLALAEAQQAGPPTVGGVDPALAAVVVGCLAYDPADRPRHAGAVGQALRSWLAGDPSPAVALAPSTAVDTAAITQPIPAVAPPQVAAPDDRTALRPRRALPIAALAAGVAALLVVAVLAAFVTGRPDAAADTQPSPSASSAPATSSPPPAWLAGLVDRVEKDCSPEEAADAEAEMADMTEDEARDYADGLVEACKDADDGGGNGRGNNGNGGGNGNGNGNGGRDD